MGWRAYLIVALGSGIGGALRHGVNVAGARLLGTGWPYGTFAVNVVGSFAIGAIVSYFALRGHGAHGWLLFLTTGVLGGFTTFSAFSLDVVVLYQRGHAVPATLYLAASITVSIAALLVGLALVRRLL
jgi:fluoride exporter